MRRGTMDGLAAGLFTTGVLFAPCSVAAQTAMPGGPLDAPALAAQAPAPSKSGGTGAKAKHAAHSKARKTAARPSAASGMPQTTPTADDGHRAAAATQEPLSLGMKWNGANDDGSKTRVQNYNGDAQGTGAEVGLKLHF